MKRAVIALRSLLGSLSAGVGLEGALLVMGTALLAVFAQSLHPFGAELVIGFVCLALGLALAVTPRKVG